LNPQCQSIVPLARVATDWLKNKKPGTWAGLEDKLLIRIFFEASIVDVV